MSESTKKKPKWTLTRDQFTVEMAREWFAYDPSAGIVIRIKNPSRGKKVAGTPAGNFHKASGMRQISFQGLYLYEQHLVWALVKGYWSPHQLGFKDGDKLNTHIENLVEVTNQGGDYNSLQSDTTASVETLSGVVQRSGGRYQAQIFREKMFYLGTFDTPAEAHQLYLRAKQVLHSPLNDGKPTLELLSQVLNVS